MDNEEPIDSLVEDVELVLKPLEAPVNTLKATLEALLCTMESLIDGIEPLIDLAAKGRQVVLELGSQAIDVGPHQADIRLSSQLRHRERGNVVHQQLSVLGSEYLGEFTEQPVASGFRHVVNMPSPPGRVKGVVLKPDVPYRDVSVSLFMAARQVADSPGSAEEDGPYPRGDHRQEPGKKGELNTIHSPGQVPDLFAQLANLVLEPQIFVLDPPDLCTKFLPETLDILPGGQGVRFGERKKRHEQIGRLGAEAVPETIVEGQTA